MKILLTGSTGYLGSLIRTYLSNQYDFICPKRNDLDLYNPESAYDYLMPQEFAAVFHMAANGQTKDCEEKPELTQRLNTLSTIEIAKICKEKNAKLVFFSTEQVFNGQVGAPFSEEQQPKSITNYGQQKIEAEEYISANLDNYLIMRLSWQFGLSSKDIKASPNIVANVINALFHKKPTLFTAHENRCMTYAYNLVRNFDKILDCQNGILHFSSKNTLTTYEAAKYIAGQLGFSADEIDKYIKPDLQRYQDRPRDYRLDNSKALSLGFELTTFENDVAECLSDFAYFA